MLIEKIVSMWHNDHSELKEAITKLMLASSLGYQNDKMKQNRFSVKPGALYVLCAESINLKSDSTDLDIS